MEHVRLNVINMDYLTLRIYSGKVSCSQSNQPLPTSNRNMTGIYPTSFDKEPNAVQVTKTAEGITPIAASRPHRRNAVDGPTGKKLTDALLDFEDDASQEVCVFRHKRDLLRGLRSRQVR